MENFNLKDCTITMDDGVEKAYEMYQKHGYVLVKGLFKEFVDHLNNELEPFIARRTPGVENMPDAMKAFAGLKTKRLTKVPLLSKTFRENFLDSDFMHLLIDKIFEEVCDTTWLATAQIMEVQPGEKAQILHRDFEVYPIFKRFGSEGPEVVINCICALSEFTEEMGATRAIPGSNLWEDFFVEGKPEQTYPIEMEKGDAFIMSGKTIHGAGANLSNKPRRAMAMGFNAGFLTPEEALPFVMPKEMVKDLPERVQQKLGFRSFHNTKLNGGSLWTVDFEDLASYLETNP